MITIDIMEKSIEDIPKINYTEMYIKLKDMKIKLDLDPIVHGFAPINEKIATIQEYKSDVSQLLLDAIINKDKWQRAYRSTNKFYYATMYKMMRETPAIKELKTVGLQESAASEKLEREAKLMRKVERHYFVEGNRTGGEALSYLEAVNTIKDDLQSVYDNLKLQLGVVDNMMYMKEISEADIKARKEAKRQIMGTKEKNDSR